MEGWIGEIEDTGGLAGWLGELGFRAVRRGAIYRCGRPAGDASVRWSGQNIGPAGLPSSA
jgi:hypothetical protein